MTMKLMKFGTATVLALLAAPAAAGEISIPFDADNFDNPLIIDNPYWPQVPGKEFLYKAETPDGCEWSHVRVAPNGPGEQPTKQITIGADTLTVRTVADFEYEDEDCGGPVADELSEKTFDWYGQDDDGNVWYFGEDTFNCDGADDCVLGGGRWEAGKDVQGSGQNAEPGIIMLGDPTNGDSYRQEFYEGFAEDWAKIMGKNADVTLRDEDAVEPGEWDDCLVTKEWNDLEGGSIEQKYYCIGGVGLVLVTEHSGKVVRFEQVDPNVDAAAAESEAFRFRTVPKNR